METGPIVEIDVLSPHRLTAEMVARWRELQACDLAWDSPFLSPFWAQAVERARGKGDHGTKVAVLREGDAFQGFMAVRAGTVTAMAAGAAMCDYQALVTAPGVTVDPRQLLSALGVHRFDFGHMLESQSAFAPYARGGGSSWIVDLPDGYDAYAAAKRAAGVHALKDLDKKRRKAERDVGPVTFTPLSEADVDFGRVFEIKRAQFAATNQTDIFATGWTRRLVEDLFGVREPDFRGALFTLRIGGELAAAQFHLCGARTIHAWMISHDPAFDRFSPGLLLFQDILRWMDGTPYTRLDLGDGDYRFKRELSNHQQGVMHGFVGALSPATLVRGAAYGVRKAAESLPLGRLSHLPGKAMRRLDLLRGLR